MVSAIINVLLLLGMQWIFFRNGASGQLFVCFSFVAGKEIVKYIVSVLSIALGAVICGFIDALVMQGKIVTNTQVEVANNIVMCVSSFTSAILYALILGIYLILINKKYVRKEYPLQVQENVFLVLPSIAAVCISITLKMMIITVENGTTTLIFDTVPETLFWIPAICVLLLGAVIANVMLFQNVVQYHEVLKGQVKFMAMVIGNNMGISNGYQNSASKTGGYKNVREYSNYLMGKYSCLKPGSNVAVSVTSGLLRKAMSDEKTGQWLERELSKAPDYIKQAQQSLSARGSRLISCSIEFGEEYTTMCVCGVTDTPGTDEDIDKWLEKVKENKEKQKKAEKKAAEEKITEQRMEEYTFKGSDLKSVTDSFIAKMSSLSMTMSSMSGFDMKI